MIFVFHHQHLSIQRSIPHRLHQKILFKLIRQHHWITKFIGVKISFKNLFFIVSICFLLAPPQGRRRRQRTVFTQSHVQQLDSIFMHNQYPDIELRESLAAQMGVPESRIQVRRRKFSLETKIRFSFKVWFKNRRTRARTAHRQQMKLAEASSSN